MQSKRICKLNTASQPSKAKSVIYIMSRDQRVHDNYALLAAQQTALNLKLPLIVLFCLYKNSDYRAREHYEFMLTGLRQVKAELAAHKIDFLVGSDIKTDKAAFITNCVTSLSCAAVYFDFSPLHGPRALQKCLAQNLEDKIPVFSIDTHNIVPVWVASNKQEYAARTIRSKINKKLADWLDEPARLKKTPLQQ